MIGMEKQPIKERSKIREVIPVYSGFSHRLDIVRRNIAWRGLPGYRVVALATVILTLALPNPHLGGQSAAGKIMPLGDSITLGFNGINYPNGSIPGGYRRQLGTRLASAGYTYDFVGRSTANAAAGTDPDHNGYGGIRTDQVLANLSTWLSANPDIVLMHLGTNDLIQHVQLATAVNNLNSLIQQITANAPNRKLFVATIIPIIDTRDGYTAAQWVGVIASYNVQVRSLVQQYANQGRKVMLVEMNANLAYTASNPVNNFFQVGDGTHPGQAGYNQMGDFWFNAIQSAGTPPPPPPPMLPTLLVNGDFESDYTGWTRSGNQSVQSTAPYAGTNGAKLVNFNGGNLAPNGVLAQTFQTTPGVTHTLTFDAGVIANNTDPQLLHVSAVGASGLLSEAVYLTSSGNSTTRWASRSFTFVANSATTTLTFRDQSTSTIALDLLLDNVRVTRAGSAPSNTAPVAAADAHSTNRDTPLVIPAPGLLGNDADAQSNPLTAVLNTGAGHGSVNLNANGGFTYTPAADHTGADSFTYRANDGSLDSNIVTVSIAVNAVGAGVLVNGSFESGITGWTVTGNHASASALPYTATNGTRLVSFNGGNQTPNATISQSFATVAGQTYALAFDAGVLSYNTNSQTMVVTVNGASLILTRSITIIGQGGGSNRWNPQSFTFVANSATTILAFRDQSASTIALDLLLDNVRVTATATSFAAAAVASAVPLASMGTPSFSQTPENVTIRMTATQAGTYFLEGSEDLITWKQIGDVLLAEPGPISFVDSRIADGTRTASPRMFYRIGAN